MADREDRVTLPAGPLALEGKPADPTAAANRAERRVGPFDARRDRFEERDELGRGGMGVVVEAFDRALKRPVAIKQMKSVSAADLARFEREAEITALLEHPGIVPIHDAGRSPDGLPYYVMRRIDGEPLDNVVAKRAFAERIARVPNLLAACDAVAFAHSRGVIHRDIKPSNILIGPFGETLVIDWGLARMLDDAGDAQAARTSDAQLTRAGSVAGTPGFMAPEQARGEALDARVDVFALGATLFYVLAGASPYSASRGTELVEQVASGVPPDWGRLPEETPPALRAIIEKAMAFARDDRYRDAGELAADVRRYVSGQFVGAYRYGVGEQLRMFVRKHRAAVAVAAVALIVIVVGATFSIQRILGERDQAQRARIVAEANARDAAAKRDQLIVQQALHLAETDPAAAIVSLRRLPADSTEWPRAASAAAAAATRGIPFGFTVSEGRFNVTFDVAPDSRHVAAMRADGGRLHIIDLHTRTRRTHPVARDLTHVTWLDAKTLIVSSLSTMQIVDRERGVVRDLALPARRSFIVSDRRGHAYVYAAGLYRIESTTTTFKAPILADASHVYPLSDDKLVYTIELANNKERLMLWSPTAPAREIATNVTLNVSVDGTRVAAKLDKQICIWDVTADPLVPERCHGYAGYETPIALVDDKLYVDTSKQIVWHGPTGVNTIAERANLAMPTANGIIFMPRHGEIEIWDRQGPFVITRPSASFNRVAQTDDARFVVAGSGNTEILVWDLSTFRPERYVHPRLRTVFAITPAAVWLQDRSEGVYRFDRRTHQEVRVATDTGERAAIDLDETWLLIGSMTSGIYNRANILMQNTLYNLRTRKRVEGEPGGTFAFLSETAFEVDPRGEVFHLSAHGEKRRVASFGGGRLAQIAIDGGYLAGISDRFMCKYAIASRRTDCIARPASPERFTLKHGAVWYIDDGALWKWSGIAPERVWPSLTLTELVHAGDSLYAAGNGALVRVNDPLAFPVSIPNVVNLMRGGNDYVFGLSAAQRISVIDVRTGITFEPLASGGLATSFAGSDDGSVAVTRFNTRAEEKELLVFKLSVPVEPAALRDWLARATNAVPVGSTDVVAWP